MGSGDGGRDWLGLDGVVVEVMMGYLGFEQRPEEVGLHRCFIARLLGRWTASSVVDGTGAWRRVVVCPAAADVGDRPRSAVGRLCRYRDRCEGLDWRG